MVLTKHFFSHLREAGLANQVFSVWILADYIDTDQFQMINLRPENLSRTFQFQHVNIISLQSSEFRGTQD